MANQDGPDGVRDASGKFVRGHPYVGRSVRRQRPIDIDPSLALAEAESLSDLYDRLVRLWDSGRLTPSQVRAGVDLVRLKAVVVGAEDTERRLAALESQGARRGDEEEPR